MDNKPPPQPLHEHVYLALRTAILSGEIRVGDRLNESHLAKQLQVSRTPIREAIRRLQQEQLLTTDAPDGIKIVEISPESAIHLYDCRIALEQLAVEGACRHATDVQIQALEQNLVEAEAVFKDPPSFVELQRSHQVDRSLRQLDLNYDFHRLIAVSSHNLWLISLLDQLANQVKLLRLQILQVPVDVEAVQAEHWELFQAIAHRDIEAAARSIRQHLQLSKTRVISVFGDSGRITQKSLVQSPVFCPNCGAHDVKKNGRRQGKQNYLCKHCGRQFIETAALSKPFDSKK